MEHTVSRVLISPTRRLISCTSWVDVPSQQRTCFCSIISVAFLLKTAAIRCLKWSRMAMHQHQSFTVHSYVSRHQTWSSCFPIASRECIRYRWIVGKYFQSETVNWLVVSKNKYGSSKKTITPKLLVKLRMKCLEAEELLKSTMIKTTLFSASLTNLRKEQYIVLLIIFIK